MRHIFLAKDDITLNFFKSSGADRSQVEVGSADPDQIASRGGLIRTCDIKNINKRLAALKDDQ